MQNLQLTELIEQHQHRIDYSKCVEPVIVEELPEEIIEIFNETVVEMNDTSLNNNDEEVYEYDLFLEGGETEDNFIKSDSQEHDCDKRSCSVEVRDGKGNWDPKGGKGHKRNQEGDQGSPLTPQKVPNLSSEGPKFDIRRSQIIFKKQKWIKKGRKCMIMLA